MLRIKPTEPRYTTLSINSCPPVLLSINHLSQLWDLHAKACSPLRKEPEFGIRKGSASAHLCERMLPSNGNFWIAELKEALWTFAELKNKMVRERKACALRNYHRMIAEFNPWIPLSFWEASPNREVWSSSKRHWFKKKFCESLEIILSVLRVNRWNKIIQAQIFKSTACAWTSRNWRRNNNYPTN